MGLPEELINRLAPLTLAADRLLPVPEVLAPLFPWGGIQRGWSVGVSGVGSWSLALSIWAEALGTERWVAVVGVPDLGLAAAAELGVRLDRMVLVETPPTSQWGTVVAGLLDAFELVAIAPTGQVGARDARRLSARAREREAVLFHLDGGRSWPTALDLTLTGRPEQVGPEQVGPEQVGPEQVGLGWSGLGPGHGHLQVRRLGIDATGRRIGRSHSLSVLLPDARGRLAPAPVTDEAIPTPVLSVPVLV